MHLNKMITERLLNDNKNSYWKFNLTKNELRNLVENLRLKTPCT